MNEQVKAGSADSAWRGLAQPSGEADFLSSWLSLQCHAISGCVRGWVLKRNGTGTSLVLAAAYPPGRSPPQELHAIVSEALERGDGVLEKSSQGSTWYLAYPLARNASAVSVVAIEVEGLSVSQLKPAMRQLQWGSAWHMAGTNVPAPPASVKPAQIALEIFIPMLEASSLPAAAVTFAVDAAQKLGLDRASVGIKKWRTIDVVAVSNAPLADQRMVMMRKLEAAMNEAADQQSAILLPLRGPDPGRVTRANEALIDGPGAAAVLTLPLFAAGETVGAIILERAEPFSDGEVAVCQAIAALAGPLLEEKRKNDHWIVTRLALGVRDGVRLLLGPKQLMLKLAALAVCAVVIAAIFFKAEYRISAPALIEAEAKRIIPVPFDGYLARAVARPGDVVKAGDVLGALDNTEAKLEQIGLTADRDQRESELQAATAKYDLGKANVLRAEIEQFSSKLELVEKRLERSVLTSPIDGLVLTGDLSQSIGEPVKTGAPLFELAPIGSFRLVIEVDESEIADAKPGQKGRAVLAALPEQTLEFELTRVEPMIEAKGGRNYYRAEGRIFNSSPALRPGFEGRAQIDIGQRPLWWTTTHRLLNWLRLQFWTWAP